MRGRGGNASKVGLFTPSHLLPLWCAVVVVVVYVYVGFSVCAIISMLVFM